MFASTAQSNLVGRSRALLAAARSLLNVEYDQDVDWEVDQEPAIATQHPHRERLGAAWRGPDRRRAGQPPAREQVCLSPLPSRDSHRRATPTMRPLPGLSPRLFVAARPALAAITDSPRCAGERRSPKRIEPPVTGGSIAYTKTGGVLLSRALAGQVPSALRGLTALFGMGRGVSPSPGPPENLERPSRSFKTAQRHWVSPKRSKNPSSPRPISTSLLQASPPFQIWPINLVVYQGSYSLKGMGELISRSASRLDAFSGYPVRT